MDAFVTALNAVLPAFFLIGVGALADRLFPHLDLPTLTRLSVYFLIPALVFNAVAGTELTVGSISLLVAAYVVSLVGTGLVAILAARGLGPVETRGVITTSLFGNTGNMGLPITLFAYGEAGLERAVVLMIVSLLLMFAAGPALLSGSAGGVMGRVVQTLTMPPIWATLLGAAVLLTPLALPSSVERGMSLLGAAAIPIMLLSLGVQMHRSWVWEVGRAAARTTVARMLVGPFVAYGAGYVLGLRGLDLNVLVLSAAMPAAVTMFVVAVEVKGDFEGVARSVVATTVASLVVITAVIYALP